MIRDIHEVGHTRGPYVRLSMFTAKIYDWKLNISLLEYDFLEKERTFPSSVVVRIHFSGVYWFPS